MRKWDRDILGNGMEHTPEPSPPLGGRGMLCYVTHSPLLSLVEGYSWHTRGITGLVWLSGLLNNSSGEQRWLLAVGSPEEHCDVVPPKGRALPPWVEGIIPQPAGPYKFVLSIGWSYNLYPKQDTFTVAGDTIKTDAGTAGVNRAV